MKLFHRHSYSDNRQESTTNGVFTTTKNIVKCEKKGCGKEGVSSVNTTLNPKIRDKIIDSQ